VTRRSREHKDEALRRQGALMDDLTWVVEDRSPAVLVTAGGPFTLRSAVAFGAVLRKLLMDRGRVMIDVSAVRVLRPATVVVFAPALTHSCFAVSGRRSPVCGSRGGHADDAWLADLEV
jgi:hypothetical protein